jgi:hypothetical protein
MEGILGGAFVVNGLHDLKILRESAADPVVPGDSLGGCHTRSNGIENR